MHSEPGAPCSRCRYFQRPPECLPVTLEGPSTPLCLREHCPSSLWSPRTCFGLSLSSGSRHLLRSPVRRPWSYPCATFLGDVRHGDIIVRPVTSQLTWKLTGQRTQEMEARKGFGFEWKLGGLSSAHLLGHF